MKFPIEKAIKRHSKMYRVNNCPRHPLQGALEVFDKAGILRPEHKELLVEIQKGNIRVVATGRRKTLTPLRVRELVARAGGTTSAEFSETHEYAPQYSSYRLKQVWELGYLDREKRGKHWFYSVKAELAA